MSSLIVQPAQQLSGLIHVPPSKSYTHRAIILASLADGTSKVMNVLNSADCKATISACEAIGAQIIQENDTLTITGVSGKPKMQQNVIDVHNSGTTLRMMTSICALDDTEVTLTGDASIQKRPMQQLVDTLKELGVSTISTTNGSAPVKITGPLLGGKGSIEGISSQMVSGLLIAGSLASEQVDLSVNNLKSIPYLKMTIQMLEDQGVVLNYNQNYSQISIPSGQSIKPLEFTVPGDYSSAAFILGAAVATKSKLTLSGLTNNDVQADRIILDILQKMGASIQQNESELVIDGNVSTHGIEVDLSNAPDLVPILAVIACFAEGTTRIINVEHARIKETDRIAAITQELKKMGAIIEEQPDGITIQGLQLHGSSLLEGYHDHRIVMSLAIATLGADSESKITDADSISVSYPDFINHIESLGATIEEQ